MRERSQHAVRANVTGIRAGFGVRVPTFPLWFSVAVFFSALV